MQKQFWDWLMEGMQGSLEEYVCKKRMLYVECIDDFGWGMGRLDFGKVDSKQYVEVLEVKILLIVS